MNMVAAAKAREIPMTNVWIFDALNQAVPAGFKSSKQLMSHGEKDWERFNGEEISKNTTACRMACRKQLRFPITTWFLSTRWCTRIIERRGEKVTPPKSHSMCQKILMII